MKEFKIIWKSLAGQADVECVASAEHRKIYECFKALCNVMESFHNKKLEYPTFEAIAQDFEEKDLQENPLFKTAQRCTIIIADDETGREMEVEADKYVYFIRTQENAELYDNFKAYINKLLFSYTF